MQLPDNLQKEYEFLINQYPDIEGLEHPYINVSDAFRAYFILAHYFTDESSGSTESMLVGVRDVSLLESAIGRQITSFAGKRKYQSPIEICSTLFYGIVKNHSFSDGNKRTALLLLLYQLDMHGYVITAHQKDFEKLVVSVAANRLKEDYKSFTKYKRQSKTKDIDPNIMTIADEIRKLVSKKDHRYHLSPTMKEFVDALKKQGVDCELSGVKMKFERIVKKRWGFFKQDKKYQYTIPFAGWTRIVGAETVRSTLKNLELYEQFATYKDFFAGKERMYMLVNEFSGPLRRLKDK